MYLLLCQYIYIYYYYYYIIRKYRKHHNHIFVRFRFEAEHFPNAVNMDSHVGLDYIVDNPDYCVKLASGKIIQRSR